MKLFTADQIRDIDQRTLELEGIASIHLMERAARGFVQSFVKHFPPNPSLSIKIMAGSGNNGGDALAIARLLQAYAYQVETWVYHPKGTASTNCLQNLKRLQQTGGSVYFISQNQDMPPIQATDILIDGLLGTGFKGYLNASYQEIVDRINRSKSTVVSIDIPSGLPSDGEAATTPTAVVKATRTLSFQTPKLAFLLPENECYLGEWEVIDIGLHPQAMEEAASKYTLLTKEEIGKMVHSRSKFSHKGTFGHALLWAGSYGKMGAALLAGKSCLRSGVGLLTCLVPPEGMNCIQTAVPEAMACASVPNTTFTAIGGGPGVGTDTLSAQTLSDLLALSSQRACVLDADALNLLAEHPSLWEKVPKESILSPHPKEFDRLWGSCATSSYQRIQNALQLAKKHRVFIVLKGAYTAICSPEGSCLFNSAGNSALATAGSGDSLTGILLALLAQGYSSKETACLGVYLHGLTADIALKEGVQSEESFVSGDISAYLGKAWFSLHKK